MPNLSNPLAGAQNLHVAALQKALRDAQDTAMASAHADLAGRSFLVDIPPPKPEAMAHFAKANTPAWVRYFNSNPKVRLAFSDDQDVFIAFMASTLVAR